MANNIIQKILTTTTLLLSLDEDFNPHGGIVVAVLYCANHRTRWPCPSVPTNQQESVVTKYVHTDLEEQVQLTMQVAALYRRSISVACRIYICIVIAVYAARKKKKKRNGDDDGGE